MKQTTKVIMAHPEEAKDIFPVNYEYNKLRLNDFTNVGDTEPLYTSNPSLFSFKKFDDDIVLYYKENRIGKAEASEIPVGEIIGARILVGSYKQLEVTDEDEVKAVKHKFEESIIEIVTEEKETASVPDQPQKKKKKGIAFLVFGILSVFFGLTAFTNTIIGALIFFAIGGGLIFLYVKKNKEE